MCADCFDNDEFEAYEERREREMLFDTENVNVELLLSELRHLTINAEQWDQNVWAQNFATEKPIKGAGCGTFGCVAGNTAVHQGYELDWYEHTVYIQKLGRDIAIDVWSAYCVLDSDGGQGDFICTVAARELGLNEVQASEFFSGDNKRDDLWRLAATFTGGAINSDHYAEAIAERAKKEMMKSV